MQTLRNKVNILILIVATGLFLSARGYAQTFYVEPTEKGFEKKISEKLDFAGIKLSPSKDQSQYTISYHYQQNKKNYKFESYIKVTDSKTDTEVYRTSVEKKAANAFNGYQAMPAIVTKLTEKELLPKLQRGL